MPRRQRTLLGDGLQDLGAIHPWHAQVQQNNQVMVTRPDLYEGCFAISGFLLRVASLFENEAHDLTVGCVIIDDQHAESG